MPDNLALHESIDDLLAEVRSGFQAMARLARRFEHYEQQMTALTQRVVALESMIAQAANGTR